jgi:hypothetical protein
VLLGQAPLLPGRVTLGKSFAFSGSLSSFVAQGNLLKQLDVPPLNEIIHRILLWKADKIHALLIKMCSLSSD